MAGVSVEEARSRARGVAPRAKTSPWVNGLARMGLAAKGLSYGIVGVLAAKLALGDGGKATSREGALATLADESWGQALLFAIAAGFAGYTIWRLVQAFLDKDDEGSDPPGLAKRAGYLGRAAIYGGLTYATLRIAVEGGGAHSQNARAQKATATVLDWPAGRWLVVLAGAAIVAAGVFNGYRAVTRSFADNWSSEMSPAERRWGCRVGTVGLLARMLVFGLIGAFLVKAALEYDPQDAIGLDGALQKLARETYGSWLLGLVAAGLVAYGVFSLIEARYRRV